MHDEVLDRDVAYAQIKTEGLDPESLQRIAREAKVVGSLGAHPNIVSLHDFGYAEGTPYLVLEYMDGGDVDQLLRAAPANRLPVEKVLTIATAVCDVLAHAHAHGMTHRDIKPTNVWLTKTGQIKLGDFGLALHGDHSRLTTENAVVGTVAYLAPEQATGGTVGPASDIYAFGAMFYEMVTGRPPLSRRRRGGYPLSAHQYRRPAPGVAQPRLPAAARCTHPPAAQQGPKRASDRGD